MGEGENKEGLDAIRRAKVVRDFVKGLPVSDAVKHMATMIATVGGNPIPFLVHALSAWKTERAEMENPPKPIPEDYTEVERVIHEMMIENTGAHILDSGDVYGRHWERNRRVDDFRRTPAVYVEVWRDGWVDVSVNVFHVLASFLDRDELCRKLEEEFYEFAESRRGTWFSLMEEFAYEVLGEKYGFEVLGAWNSYNWDNILSQVIQGITFSANGNYYVILQIHNGCDVRGGYTKPRFFRLIDEDGFYHAMCSFGAKCGCTTYSYDCGDVWIDGEETETGDNGLPKHWKPVPEREGAEDWEYKLVCEKCGKEVKFYNAWIDDTPEP